MKLCAMRYKGYTWHHNPKSLEISSEKKVLSVEIPYCADVVKNFGEKELIISGVGELYGEDCFEQYSKLRKLYEESDTEVLCLPNIPPMYAYFKKLNIEADDKENVLTYSFTFVRENKKSERKHYTNTYTVKGEKSLWEISAKTDTDIDELIKLNPQLMFVDELKDNDEVCIC